MIKKIKETPKDQEKGFAKRAGGHRNSGSGAYRSNVGAKGSGYRGDVTLKDFVFECKQTEKASVGLKLDWLEKISIGAKPKCKKPGMQLQFNNSSAMCSHRWVLIEEEEFLRLLNDE